MATLKKKTAKKKVGKTKAARKVAAKKSGDAPSVSEPTVDFYYLKSPAFHTIHVDGAHGGLTPNGYLSMSLYSERPPIPRRTVQKLTEEGKLGEEIVNERESKEGVIRQIEVNVLMSTEVVANLRNWLNLQLAEFEQRNKVISEHHEVMKREGGIDE
jgi:hypothetical protein